MTMSSVTGLWDYMKERESIRIKRLDGKRPPWTKDPVLQKYKFTNVQREHDRTSIAFRQIYEQHYRSAPDATLLLNCAIARWFGTAEFYQSIGWQANFNPESLVRAAADRMLMDKPVFTRAYVITNGGQKMPKPDYVVEKVLTSVAARAEEVCATINTTRSWMRGYVVLRECEGHGGTGFMAKEVLLDYIQFVPALVDAQTWTPVGPGALRGLGRIMAQDPYAKPKDPLAEVLRIQAMLKSKWAKTFPYARPLSAHDVQFCLCEYSKYERVRLGEGPAKNTYTPKEN